jgi:cytoskeleton protein RodZ
MSETSIHDMEQKTVGSCLREARELQGLSLEEAARTTRISKAYLKALEEDDIDKLPSEAYAKGFQRVYAQYLSVAEEELNIRREHCSSVCQNTDEHDDLPHKHCCSALSPPARTVWEAVRPFMFLVVVVVSALFFFFSPKKPLPPHTIKLTPPPVAEKIVAGSVHEKPNVSPDEKPLPVIQETGQQMTSGTAGEGREKFVLRLRAFEDGSLDLTIDEMTTQHYDLKAGDLIEWKGEKVFSLDLENAGGVEAELNGKLLKPFGEKGVPAHIVLSAGYDGEKTAP